MQSNVHTFFRSAFITIALGASGCASLSEAELEMREYSNVEYREVFREFRQKCFQQGGRIIIDARGKVGRDGVPRRGDNYFCA